MKKKIWIWLLIVSIALFVANIICAIVFRGETGTNIFTTISGWVSGIATIVLGVIALYINSKYKQDEDERIWKNRLIDELDTYKKNVIDIYNELKQTNCMEILERIMQKELDDVPTLLDVLEIENINLKIHNTLIGLSFCTFYIDLKDELFKNYLLYMQKLIFIIRNASKIIFDKKIDIVVETKRLYENVMMFMKLHLIKVDVFISNNIIRKSKKELENIIDEHKKLQQAWWNDNKTILAQEQNNG